MSVTHPLKWHGGKSYLAKRIIGLAPPRAKNSNAPASDDPGYVHYVEPFFGGGSVLLENDPEGISEVANDIHRGLFNFWRSLRDPAVFAVMRDIVEAMPFSEEEYSRAAKICGMAAFDAESVQGRASLAAEFFLFCRQSMAGRMKGFAPLTRNRTRRGMNEQAAAWLSAVDGLGEVHARLRRVVVLNQDFAACIKGQDGPRTWFYIDPPYVPDSRASPEVYRHELPFERHRELLDILAGIQGRFALSGYHCPEYDAAAERAGWRLVEFDLPNHAAGGAKKRRMVECLWMNY